LEINSIIFLFSFLFSKIYVYILWFHPLYVSHYVSQGEEWERSNQKIKQKNIKNIKNVFKKKILITLYQNLHTQENGT
jgi:hypothetical protein